MGFFSTSIFKYNIFVLYFELASFLQSLAPLTILLDCLPHSRKFHLFQCSIQILIEMQILSLDVSVIYAISAWGGFFYLIGINENKILFTDLKFVYVILIKFGSLSGDNSSSFVWYLKFRNYSRIVHS